MIRLCAFADEASSSIDGQINALRRNDIKFIEVRGINGKNISALTIDEAREYASAFSSAGITVWSIGSPIGKVALDSDLDAHIDLLHHVCKLAQIFKTDKIRMFSFFKAHNSARVIEMLRRMTSVAAGYGIRLCHENEKEIYGEDLARVCELLENVDGLECVYDPANFVQVGENAAYARNILTKHITYYHIKDIDSKTGELVPSGYGDADISGLVATLSPEEDHVLTVEPHLALFEGYSEIDGAEMKNRFKFASSDAAFDAACEALVGIIKENGYKKVKGGYSK